MDQKNIASEYNGRYYAEICCCDFDANEYLLSLGSAIVDSVTENGHDLLRLMLSAKGEGGDLCEAYLSLSDKVMILRHAMKERRTDLPVVLNARACAGVTDLAGIIDQAILDVSGEYNLSVVVYNEECSELKD